MKTPPKILLWLLDIICPADRQDLKGDFLELYETTREESGRSNANWKFLSDILTVIPLKFIIKGNPAFRPAVFMISTNLKIAKRHFAKNKLNTFINLVGLTVSLSACILITLFVQDELSYDKHFRNYDRIYRITMESVAGEGRKSMGAMTSYLLLPILDNKVKGVEKMCRVDFRWETVNVDQTKSYQESEVVFTDSTFFEIFSLPFIAGNPNTALNDPNNVVLDETTALKYFGNNKPIGKTILVNDKLFSVSGVIRDFPVNSHFSARLIFPFSGVEQWYQDWVKTNFSGTGKYTYFKAQENFDVNQFNEEATKLGAARWGHDNPPKFFAQPLTSIHLESHLAGEINTNGSLTAVYIFSLVALIVLALACINYINLSMAASLQRIKEVAIKKILGSTPRMQLAQFQTESLIMIFFSGALAIVVTSLSMPMLNAVSGKFLEFNILRDPYIGPGLLIIIIAIGLMAGGFPALLLLRSNATGLLYGKLNLTSKSPLRSMLIMFQFSISIALIAATLIAIAQMNFIKKKDLGIDPEQLVMIPFQTYEIGSRSEVLKSELLKNSAILNVASSGDKVTAGVSGSRPYVIKGKKDTEAIASIVVSHDFFETMRATMAEGRSFSRDFPSDSSKAYIINESAAKLLNMDRPIGEPITGYTFTGSKWYERNAQIIGVVKDFHFASLHTEVGPIIFSLASPTTEACRWMEVRIANTHAHETIEFIEQQWKMIAPERPFQFQFMNEDLELNYLAEARFLKIFEMFSILSIILGALGLFGLMAIMARRRTKEIGIRKIVGASTFRLIKVLSVDLLKLVVISNFIGWPIAYYFMNQWLQNFAYQTTIPIWIFFLTGLATTIIAFAAILYHTLRASLANPVSALRCE